MKTVYFVRHGETEYNKEMRFQHYDTPLSEVGISQACQVAERFNRISVEALISSDMTRALQTAEKISAVSALAVEECALFHERLRPSVVRGKIRTDAEITSVAEFIDNSYYEVNPEKRHSDEETFSDIVRRGLSALSLLERRAESRLAVVTHGEFLKTLLALMLFKEAITPKEHMVVNSTFYPGNTGITMCIFRDSGWHVWTWSDQAHLG